MECPKCKILMIRRKSKFNNSYWWGCKNFPKCKITSAEHPDGTLMSTPADTETKELRIEAHSLAEEIWGEWGSFECKVEEMYDWLETNTSTGHIGKLEKDELEELVKKLKKLIPD